jgi:predicted unusual protein kinase regulating ubiquinone biosynthesis (AarF/ABC1/UbiB family)
MNVQNVMKTLGGKKSPAEAPIMRKYSELVRPMSRRRLSHAIDTVHVPLPRARRVVFEPGLIRPIGRLFVWIWGLTRFLWGDTLDRLRHRSTEQSRAIRLRSVFEDAGPTFAKLGQQLSMRADILPYAYCAELGKMLDQAPPFPTPQALEVIERNLGRPLAEVFATLDPEPIGSASLACVYQARLKTGERVAVKVRRPGIGPLIAADLRALDWLLILLETLTIIIPGVTRRFREDFQTILFNELNFRTEARFTDLFRRRSAKRRRDVTAPRVYFEYCSEEVLVTEFVSGIWMWELLIAVDKNDQEFLAKAARQGIEPKALARKLVMIMHREIQEELFFHADPHPANLVIMPNNKICFIDFGAVARFSTATRLIFRELWYHMLKGDIGRMVNCSINLMGPLPPMDVEDIRYHMENIYADWLYAQASTDAEWWERSTAQAWLRFLEISQMYSIPATFETIQFLRVSFSYDSIVTRLHKDIDVAKEWQSYALQAAQEARKRVQKSVRKRIWGPTDMDYLQMEQLADTISQFMFRLQRSVETPIVNFKNIVGKIAYVASLLFKLGYLAGAGICIALIADAIARRFFDYEIDWASLTERVTNFGWVQLILIGIALIIIRRIVIRLNMPDTRLGPDTG